MKPARARMRLNKRAIELSVGFVVILVLAVVVFGLGISFARTFFQKAEGLKADVDSQTEMQIRRLLDRGERVAIPLSRKTVRPGAASTFAIGVMNVLGQTRDFRITIKPSEVAGCYAQDFVMQTITDQRTIVTPLDEVSISSTIENNAKSSFIIKIDADDEGFCSDVFAFTVTVKTCPRMQPTGCDIANMESYGNNAYKLYIEIG
ncbi:hypothetical protein JXB02_04735 [Candidatus Woesearchaeota archaeon]|nr:hypothetical protein [Candidatus Woesearchaeota archaeon]